MRGLCRWNRGGWEKPEKKQSVAVVTGLGNRRYSIHIPKLLHETRIALRFLLLLLPRSRIHLRSNDKIELELGKPGEGILLLETEKKHR